MNTKKPKIHTELFNPFHMSDDMHCLLSDFIQMCVEFQDRGKMEILGSMITTAMLIGELEEYPKVCEIMLKLGHTKQVHILNFFANGGKAFKDNIKASDECD